MTHAKRRKRWRALLTDYCDSELPTLEWCEKNGVTDHQLRYWRRKIGETQPSASWACVEIVDDTKDAPRLESGQFATGETGVTVHVGAATIEVRPGFDSAFLFEVLRVVVATC